MARPRTTTTSPTYSCITALAVPSKQHSDCSSASFAAELPALRSTFLEVRERYANTTDVGAVGYAEQALEVEPEANANELRADAVDAVQRFFAALDP